MTLAVESRLADVLPYVVSVILGGGFLGGIYALLKLRPEAGQITVTAAQGAVIVQSGVIDTLRAELARAQGRIQALEAEQTRVQSMEDRINGLEDERDQLLDRVRHLEMENASLRDDLQAIRGTQ